MGERAPNCFHDIESLFLPVSLGDGLQFRIKRADQFSVSIAGMPEKSRPGVEPNAAREKEGALNVPLEKNLMYKAARLFYEKKRRPFALEILIKKKIPTGAGLGGGSSDAAAVLLVLNSASVRPLKRYRLMQAAASAGSDVPFFLSRAPAYVYGQGESVQPFLFEPSFAILIVKPPFASDTRAAFTLLDKKRAAGLMPPPPPWAGRRALVEMLNLPPSRWTFYNDFQPVFLSRASPRADMYRMILSTLKEAGAAFVSLSGSGSCVYGIFETRPEAAAAVIPVTDIIKPLGCTVWRCTPLKPNPRVKPDQAGKPADL